MSILSKEDGDILIELVRNTILSIFEKTELVVSDEIKAKFSEHQGVFVTIHKHGKLRGCIGYPSPVMPLYEAVISAAKSAAFQDPRFTPLNDVEFKKIDVEISVLSSPERLSSRDPEEIIKNIKVGRDGLIIKNEGFSGLLLPQVATEYEWDSEQFLKHTCNKAGLNENAWMHEDSRLYTFQAQVFNED